MIVPHNPKEPGSCTLSMRKFGFLLLPLFLQLCFVWGLDKGVQMSWIGRNKL